MRIFLLLAAIIGLPFCFCAGEVKDEAEKIYLEAYRYSLGQGRPVNEEQSRRLYLQAAEMKDPRALAWKAQQISRGKPPFEKDKELGRKLFQEIEPILSRMAEQDLPGARKCLVSCWVIFEPKEKGSEAFRWMSRLAEQGDPDAMGYLGWFYEDGIGTEKDPVRSFEHYRKASEAGDVLSCWNLGVAYQKGAGTPPDPKKAFASYLRGAQQNEASCQNMVGICLFEGTGVTPDEAEAFSWFQKSAQQGNASSQDWLGWLYEVGRGTKANPQKASEWFQKSAEAGFSSGQKNLARCYEDGIGVTPDPVQAFRYFLKAAEGGDRWAMGKVAKFFEIGKGTNKNPSEAFRWWRRQAESGDFWGPENVARCYQEGIGTEKNPEEARKGYGEMRVKLEEEAKKNSAWAWDNLGRFYFNGLGVEKNYKKALEYYRKAADLKSGWAMEQIGWCYEKGFGVDKDETEALEWYQKAGAHGQMWSMNQAGSMYEQGSGVEKDLKKACAFYLKSAQAGNSWGQYHLGDCYYGGRGVPQDYRQAFAWFVKSASQGNEAGLGGLAACYELGQGVKKDEQKAVGLYLESANRGRSWSMGRLAQMYEDGRGTEKKPVETFQWWKRKAETGDFWAPEKVARCYQEGIGTEKNPEEARKWYGGVRAKLEEEAKKNSAWAWDNLGRYYFNGLGVVRDYAKALECYHKAADLKSGWAMEQIGRCYERGLGLTMDDKEALKWYRKAAENGQAWSMGQVAIFCENGRGTEKNPAETYRWFRKKAETGSGDPWADENVGRCYENAIGTQKDDPEALRWYRKAAEAGSLWAGEQAGRFFEEGLGVKKNPEEAYRYFLPSVQAKRPWAQYRMVSLGSSQIYEGKYDFAERCFQAAWDSGYRPGAEWLYQIHVVLADHWEKSNPLKGIQVKRASLHGDSEEGSVSGALAGEALRLGYVAEAKQIVQELLNSPRIQAKDFEKARWHALAGYAAMVDPQVDPTTVQKKRFPESWLKQMENPLPVGMVNFNMKFVYPQSLVDFRYSGDFMAPLGPRRLASYLVQHLKWGVRIWREQRLHGLQTLALTAASYPGQGGAFLWGDGWAENWKIAEEQFQKAESLAPNFQARMGRAVLAWQRGDSRGTQLALDPVQKELKEETLAAEEKGKKKDSQKRDKRSAEWRWSRQVKRFADQGILPWGNAKGEVNFGFGYSHGSGLFYEELTSALWKLAVPFFLWLKPDWMLTAADLIVQSGNLAPMQMVDLYRSLAEKPETRGKACARLAMMQAQMGEKDEAWKWAEKAAQERSSDPEIVRMAATFARWADQNQESEKWQKRFYEVQAKRELLSKESPEAEYLRAFEALREAEKLEALDKKAEAEPKFRKVLQDLKRLNEDHPEWENAVVQYRIHSLEKKLSRKEAKP